VTKKKKGDIKRPKKNIKIDKEQPKFKEVLTKIVKKTNDKENN